MVSAEKINPAWEGAANASFAAEPTPKITINAPTKASPLTNLLSLIFKSSCYCRLSLQLKASCQTVLH
jgi:hypothetical protein